MLIITSTIMVTALLQRHNLDCLELYEKCDFHESLPLQSNGCGACISNAGANVNCWVVLPYRSLFIILYSLMTQRWIINSNVMLFFLCLIPLIHISHTHLKSSRIKFDIYCCFKVVVVWLNC